MAGRPKPMSSPVSPVVPLHLPQPVLARAPLPTPLTSLVDREREVAEIGDLLGRDEVRLVTLTGAGGVGKTRLAIRAGEALEECFAAGVAFVPLVAVANPKLVTSTIFQALGGRDPGDEGNILHLLRRLLANRLLLLILDNFEHLLPAAPTIADLLAHAPRLKILVTSRAVLRLSGEHRVPVAPLSLPDLDPVPSPDRALHGDAVRLFVQRGRGARPDFALTAANAPAIAAICQRLDGIPLAIELAAARLTHLSPAAILDRLDRPGPTHLPLLTGGPRDVPPRQQTMRNAIAWSDALLEDGERALFRRLAVFVGGFTVESAAIVCETDETATLDGIAALIDASLVRDDGDVGGEPRYGMLETIREFGLERLAASGEEDAIRERHARWCLALTTLAGPLVKGSHAGPWLERLEREHANLRAALAWIADRGDTTVFLQLAGSLAWFWEEHGHVVEGGRWLEAALAVAKDAPAADRLRGLSGAGTMAWYQGDFARATHWHEQALTLARQVGDHVAEAVALNDLGVQAMEVSDHDQAILRLEQSLTVARTTTASRPVLSALHNLAQVARLRGDHADAIRRMEETMALAREHGDTWLLARGLTAIGHLLCDVGNLERAAASFRGSLDIGRAHDNVGDIVDAIEGLARVGAISGHSAPAAGLFGATAALRAASGMPYSPSDIAYFEPVWSRLRTDLGDEAFGAATAAGQRLPLAAAIAEALAFGTIPTAGPHTANSRRPESAHGLTARETEILRLLAAGESNREIAERLFISPATVARHLSNLYAKLDVDSRSKATAFAHRHGLA